MQGSSKSETIYVALGSNLGDRAGNIRLAMKNLQALSEGSMVTSSLWESEAIDCPDGSGNFLNAVVQLVTSLKPLPLLARLQDIETRLGRSKERERNAPRTIDLDIISYGDQTINDPDLVVPHPRAKDRLFVLEPLAEIAPDLRLPGFKETVSALRSKAPCDRIKRVGSRKGSIRKEESGQA